MKPTSLFLVVILSIGSPAIAANERLDCPDPAAVVPNFDGTPSYLSTLAWEVGSAMNNNDSLAEIAKTVRGEFPEADDSQIADVMIAAFCTYLNTDAPPEDRHAETVTSFAQQTYDAVFEDGPHSTHQRQRWLNDN